MYTEYPALALRPVFNANSHSTRTTTSHPPSTRPYPAPALFRLRTGGALYLYCWLLQQLAAAPQPPCLRPSELYIYIYRFPPEEAREYTEYRI